MSLPNFLKPSSPPRSPHVAPPSFFAPATSYFSGSNARPSHSNHPTAHAMLRPTKRDVLLCLVTLTFSFLFFSQPSTPSAAVDSPNSGHGIGGWSWRSSFSSKASGSAGAAKSGYVEEGFSDTVRSVGLSSEVNNAATEDELAELAELKAGTEVKDQWDEEEEMEDDEFDNKVTILAGHQPGWTLFERLYLYNGSFYVVTDEPSDWPELRMMTSTGLPANNEPGNSEAREPKGDEIIYIKPHDAAKLWGPRVYKMAGTTWLFNDGQFIDHYYHFAAELLLGAWRAMASLDQDIGPTGETALPPPRRIWFLHQTVEEWRDKPKFNPTILFALFPSTSLLYPEDFRDIARASRSNKPSAYLLDRALLADRSAAFRGPWTGPTARTVASAMHVGETSRWWWEPIRRQILRYSGVAERIINRNLEGYGAIDPVNKDKTLATPKGQSDFEPLREAGTYKPLVTYISRQSSRRRLTKESHEELVKAVQERSEKVGFEFKVVEAEKLTQEEQFSLAARTTIMLGVHGNGLTHLLWMPPTPRSAVIEMFFTGGFARDYQWTAHALGIRHFGVQHDFSFTLPNLPPVDYPEGFQGTSITVVGKVVADLIEDRLAGRI